MQPTNCVNFQYLGCLKKKVFLSYNLITVITICGTSQVKRVFSFRRYCFKFQIINAGKFVFICTGLVVKTLSKEQFFIWTFILSAGNGHAQCKWRILHIKWTLLVVNDLNLIPTTISSKRWTKISVIFSINKNVTVDSGRAIMAFKKKSSKVLKLLKNGISCYQDYHYSYFRSILSGYSVVKFHYLFNIILTKKSSARVLE